MIDFAANSPPRSSAIRLVLWLGLLLAATACAPLETLAQSDRPLVVVGQIDGTITPVMARYVDRVISGAEHDDAAAVVFEMDTPGGLSSAMDDIIRDILESEVPVVVYVTPRGARAASAGVYISYAAHVAAMAPGTNIGSASPVFMGADGDANDPEDTMTKKVTNDAVAQIVNLANLRGRSAKWAEEAVREAVNITADEAEALNVVDLLAPDLETLLEAADGRTVQMAAGTLVMRTAGADIDERGMNVLDRILQVLVDPTVAYLFLSLGLLGIFFELSNPGALIPAVIGITGVLIGLFGLGTLPVNWTGVLLIVLAFGLFVAELYVPSMGTLTLGGMACFLFGSYLLIDEDSAPGFEVSEVAIWSVAASFVAFFLAVGYLVMRVRRKRPATGQGAMLGAVGTVRETLQPEGMVFAFGEHWAAVLDPGSGIESLLAGERVIVTGIDKLRLTVRPATSGEWHSPESRQQPEASGAASIAHV